MTERSVVHGTVVIERTYDASPTRVFSAWADPAARARWSAPGIGWENASTSYDFRIGGRETTYFGPPGAPLYCEVTHYEDIVPNRRIVSSGTISHNETRIFSALLTVELLPEGSGTRLIVTEQGAFFDGEDSAIMHEQGWGEILDKLEAELRRESAGN